MMVHWTFGLKQKNTNSQKKFNRTQSFGRGMVDNKKNYVS
jgi:hypothetical protein